MTKIQNDWYQDIALAHFKNRNGENYQLTKGQSDIFRLVYDPSIRRVGIKAVTQFGKSEVTALALIYTALQRKEKILIVSPSMKQSAIIMGYIIDHIFDHPYITQMMVYEGSLERLKQERSKKRITFRNGAEIFILTAIAREVKKEAISLMGFGATIVVVDERGLLPRKMFNKILRMVGGTKGKIIQLGNPFPGEGFEDVFNNPRYTTLTINDEQALKEGRITQEFLDEVIEEFGGKDTFDYIVFYKCRFPEQGSVDAVIPIDLVNDAVNRPGCEGDHRQAGLDVARFGGDKTVYIFRVGGVVKRMEVVEKMDTMAIVGQVGEWISEDEPDVLAVDVIGIGSGVYDRLEELEEEGKLTNKKGEELDIEIEPINVGAGPTDDEMKEKYVNLRAQIFFSLGKQFKQGAISIPDDVGLKKQLSEIRYKFRSERKRQIEPKEEMKKRLGHSPDKADALALAFFDTSGVEPELFIATV